MNRKPLSIRSTLLLAVGTLTLVIALLVLWKVITGWQQLEKIHSLREAMVLSDGLFDATEKFFVERDIAFSMLHAGSASTIEKLKPRLKESRKASDEAFRVSLESLTPYAFPELIALRKEIESRLLAIKTLRAQIDTALTLPEKQREKALADDWYKESTGLSQQAEVLWVQFVRHFTNIDPIVTQHLRFKYFLRIITDYTGRQRAIIGRLLVENSYPDATESADLLRGQGIIDLSWKTSNILAHQSELYTAIGSYYSDAQSHYQTLSDMVQDVFYVPGARHSAAYPMDVNLWFELSEQTIESFDSVKIRALEEMRIYATKLETEAKHTIILHTLLFAATLSLCLYSFWLITRRVIKPINAMVGALVDTMEGNTVTFIAPANRDDEIGKLAKVFYAFQKNMVAIQQASIELERSETRLCAVVDHTLDGLITISEHGIIENFNHACERIFGYSALEVIGQNIKMLMPEPYHSGHDGYLSHHRETGDTKIIGTAGREVSGKRKDGSVFPMDLSVSAFQLEDGRHFSGIIRDITARKNAEQSLLEYTEALEHSNKELDDFAYIASHDLKEPLRGIHNHSRFLLEDNEGKLDEESVKKLNRLVYLSQRMERLVNDLLYFSRLGRQELAIQSTDINEVIQDIEKTLYMFLTERNAKIHIPIPMPVIICDNPRVTELFRNLITNAVKYNNKPEKMVEVGFLKTHSEHHDVFYVKDDGKGIAPEFHDEIFRIFKRLQSSKDGAEEGTGVGLTFVKKIVERHGGKIWLESEIGQGSIFYFTLEGTNYDTAKAA